MVCHETYKDENNKWLSPNEVATKDGKNFFLKKNNTKKVKVGPPESMSKSRKNTIDPEKIIENYGADAVRLFILSDSPPEKDIQWSEQGINAAYKFLQKLWILHQNIKKKLSSDKNESNETKNISKFTNQLINKINKNLDKFHYNGIIANFYETYNFMIKEIEKPINKKDLLENYKKILNLMMPVIPHFSSECLKDIKTEKINVWPIIDKKYLIEDEIEIVVQINGKKRTNILCKKGIDEENLFKLINENEKLKKFLNEKKIIKNIYIKDKLINLILK